MAHPDQDAAPAAPPVSADAVAPRRDRPPVPLEPAHLYRAVFLLFALGVALRFFDVVTRFLLIAYATGILSVGLNALGRRLPLQRRWLAAAVGLVGIGVVVLALTLGVPVIVHQVRNVVATGPAMLEQIQGWEAWLQRETGVPVRLPHPGEGDLSLRGLGAGLGGALTLVEGVLMLLVVFFGALFALASPNERLLTPLLRAVRRDLRPAVYRIFQLLGERIVGWLRGVAVAMIAVGTLSVIAYTVIGLPNALLLGLLNGVLEFVPLAGPWVGGGIAVLMALIDDPAKAPWVALAALVIQQIEANLVTPVAMSREAEIHPFLTLFGLVFFGWLFGFLGVLLALPLVLLVWTVVQVLWVERAIDTDRDPIAPVVSE